MTNPAPAKPVFTRRRVVVATVLLVPMLAVAVLVFGLFSENSDKPMTVTVIGFEQWMDSTPAVAVVRIENISNQQLCLTPEYTPNTLRVMLRRYDSEGLAYVPFGSPYELDPSGVVTGMVQLPEDGRVMQIKFRGVVEPRKLPRYLAIARELLYRIRGAERRVVSVESEQLIQCPRLLPDGTVEPARVVTKEPR